MASALGPIEICCDAPPYGIVRACSRVGIRSPEDVRWLRATTDRAGRPAGQRGLFAHLWGMFRGVARHPVARCTCGGPMPDLGLVVVTFGAGEGVAYLLGQCRRCRTVFWDEP
jgi:hypothetical protein